jgi:hypothetical protein
MVREVTKQQPAQDAQPQSSGWGGWFGSLGATGGEEEVDPYASEKAMAADAANAEAYPGFSQGHAYQPKTETDMFWKPTAVAAQQGSRAANGPNCGVGVLLVFDPQVQTLVVDEVVEGGAAARSGLVQVDDIVCEVDGINVTGQPLDIVDALMRGQEVSTHPYALSVSDVGSCDLRRHALGPPPAHLLLQLAATSMHPTVLNTSFIGRDQC